MWKIAGCVKQDGKWSCTTPCTGNLTRYYLTTRNEALDVAEKLAKALQEVCGVCPRTFRDEFNLRRCEARTLLNTITEKSPTYQGKPVEDMTGDEARAALKRCIEVYAPE